MLEGGEASKRRGQRRRHFLLAGAGIGGHLADRRDLLVLHEIEPELLMPDRCEGLWVTEAGPLSMGRVEAFFDGVHAPQAASAEVIGRAVRSAVQRGLLMARWDGRLFLRQALPDGPLSHDLELLVPPPPVRGAELGPKELPEAWKDGRANLAAMGKAVSARRGHAVPFVLLRDAVSEALGARLFEVIEEGLWPCGPDDIERVNFRIVEIIEINPAELVSAATQEVWASPSPTLGKLKTALEAHKGRSLSDEVFRKAAEGALARGLFSLVEPTKPLPPGKALADVRVRKPKVSLFAEAQLLAKEVQDFAGVLPDLKRAAPELDFAFRVTITAEGDKPGEDVIAEINKILARVSSKWRLE